MDVMKKTFDVTGMTCSACSAHVEKSVAKVAGVRSVTVNLLSNNMAVDYDESAVNDAAITAAFANVPISQKILCETLDCMRPSVSTEMLSDYDKLRDKMTGLERQAARTPIGYKRQTN